MTNTHTKPVVEGSANLNIYIKNELHKRLEVFAKRNNKPVNKIVEQWIEKYIPEL